MAKRKSAKGIARKKQPTKERKESKPRKVSTATKKEWVVGPYKRPRRHEEFAKYSDKPLIAAISAVKSHRNASIGICAAADSLREACGRLLYLASFQSDGTEWRVAIAEVWKCHRSLSAFSGAGSANIANALELATKLVAGLSVVVDTTEPILPSKPQQITDCDTTQDDTESVDESRNAHIYLLAMEPQRLTWKEIMSKTNTHSANNGLKWRKLSTGQGAQRAAQKLANSRGLQPPLSRKRAD